MDMIGDNAANLGMVCSVCGRGLKPFGNRRLKDGVMCRVCNGLISPWLIDAELAQMTAEDVRKHLEEREANKARFETFSSDRVVEGRYTLRIDDTEKCFCFDRNGRNPDIVPLDDIDLIAIYEEPYPDSEGSIDVGFSIGVNHQKFRTIRFRLNEFPGIEKGSEEYSKAYALGLSYMNALLDKEVEK